jgi:hypothetical protein
MNNTSLESHDFLQFNEQTTKTIHQDLQKKKNLTRYFQELFYRLFLKLYDEIIYCLIFFIKDPFTKIISSQDNIVVLPIIGTIIFFTVHCNYL